MSSIAGRSLYEYFDNAATMRVERPLNAGVSLLSLAK